MVLRQAQAMTVLVFQTHCQCDPWLMAEIKEVEWSPSKVSKFGA